MLGCRNLSDIAGVGESLRVAVVGESLGDCRGAGISACPEGQRLVTCQLPISCQYLVF